MEETGIDVASMKHLTTIDFPLWNQKEYCLSLTTQNEAHVLVPTAHGVAASGSLFICREDNTVLLFQRSFLGDFGGTWAGVGGAIGEDRAPVYKTLFKFRTYVYSVSKVQKRMWEGKSLPRINYEHLTYQWVNLDELFNQIKDFDIFYTKLDSKNLAIDLDKDEVTRFLRAYTAQIPLAATSMDIRRKLLGQGKFSLYIRNPYSRLYELILPGAAYTLWKLYKFLTLT
jgi:8-oxo-dGTP pyrophosphatase MutT (NUDIX family)